MTLLTFGISSLCDSLCYYPGSKETSYKVSRNEWNELCLRNKDGEELKKFLKHEAEFFTTFETFFCGHNLSTLFSGAGRGRHFLLCAFPFGSLSNF